MIQMSVVGLTRDPKNSQPIVILNDQSSDRALPIWIGALEARAISLALEHVKGDRPMTHDLLLNLIQELGYTVEKVEIDAVKSDTYFATIRLGRRDRTEPALEHKSIDARPSDAIALALAANAPIFASSQVIEIGSVKVMSEQEEKEMENEAFKKFVEGVKASDFKVPGISVTAEGDDELESQNGDIPEKPAENDLPPDTPAEGERSDTKDCEDQTD